MNIRELEADRQARREQYRGQHYWDGTGLRRKSCEACEYMPLCEGAVVCSEFRGVMRVDNGISGR